ncbi:MAG: bifunctional 5,10-methylene-tetrahydrofolate dehydrogenase/5,10-methylene-tetrahydrofolate cyclohydrolase [Dehalococcoidia bacterium]|nr:bifunctional 5,10-methylene-tetrahydrofolate dehydrogenase/5,10-methylene-tetrahydrofolate cyclohydrolase [Dehalococcoidia bacterium]
MPIILDGKATAAAVRDEVRIAVVKLKSSTGTMPGLAAVLVGNDPASAVYVRNKERACAAVGMHAETIKLPELSTQDEILSVINRLNEDNRFHGILLQLPLPKHIDEGMMLRAINPGKDVDCIHPVNVGLLSQGESHFLPATPGGIQKLLIRNGHNPSGKHLVICGRSNIVGKPLAIMMAQKRNGANATVTVCHTGTQDMSYITAQADILVAAVGFPNAITADMVGSGAIVIDVGINRVEDKTRKTGYRLVGDVDFDNVSDKVMAISPVPGGVGPMTIAQLLVNTLTSAQLVTGEKLNSI